jgi:hypothetical protein
MIDLVELKKAITSKVRDKELASSSCHEIEAYAKHWPYIFSINDWDVWNENKKTLKLQVIRWLEEKGVPYDFYQFRNGWGLIGFKSQEAAGHFKLRWSSPTDDLAAPNQDWNPHPLKSTFEPSFHN